jgi:signal transduction histidine kinase
MRWRSRELVFAPLRVLPLLVTAAFLAALHGPSPVLASDWVFGMSAAVLTGLGAWLPFPASVAQSVLLVASLDDGARTAMPMLFLLAMITLAELWVRRDDWRRWVGAAAFAAAQVALFVPHFDLVLSTSSIAMTTLPPVLLGVYVRSILRRAITAERGREQAVRDARVAERTAIARELHDLVAHHMAAIAVQVGAARHTLNGSNAPVEAALSEVHTTTRTALTDLKRLMTILRDPTTASDDAAVMAEPAGLATALDAVVTRVRAAGVEVATEIDTGVHDLDAIRRLAVLRVVQEGLTNVVKHAGHRARARLTVSKAGDTTRVTIADNGPGERPKGRPGFGLIGMRERVELLGGAISVRDHSPGWTLEVTIP